MVKVNSTDKLVFDLEMFQIDFNESKKESLKNEIAEKAKKPLTFSVRVNMQQGRTASSSLPIIAGSPPA